jgi:hypothetical protein
MVLIVDKELKSDKGKNLRAKMDLIKYFSFLGIYEKFYILNSLIY